MHGQLVASGSRPPRPRAGASRRRRRSVSKNAPRIVRGRLLHRQGHPKILLALLRSSLRDPSRPVEPLPAPPAGHTATGAYNRRPSGPGATGPAQETKPMSSTSTSTSTRRSVGERSSQDKLAELHQQISDGVTALVDSDGMAGDARCCRPVPLLQPREPATDHRPSTGRHPGRRVPRLAEPRPAGAQG